MHANRRYGVVGGKPDGMNRQTWFVRDTTTGTNEAGPFCSIALAIETCREANEGVEWIERQRENMNP